MYRKLTRREVNRLEQRTLRVSVFAIIGLAIAGIGWGLYIGSEAVMLDGFYALTSLLGRASICWRRGSSSGRPTGTSSTATRTSSRWSTASTT